MKLSQRISAVVPSATLAVTARAKAMRASGIDIVALSAGEPDFDTPDNIKRAAHEAIDRGESKYTPVPGTPALRQAVARNTAASYGFDVQPEQVIVGAGGKQVLFNACAALLDPGDEAVLVAPHWVSYPDMIRFAGADVVLVHATDAQGFVPAVEELQAAFTTRTRLLILNSPCNPTGAAFSREQLERIADIVRARPDVVVITDDIYESLVYDAPFVSIAHVAPDLRDRMLIVSGVSKSYAMTGWRIGYGIGPVELISAMGRLQGASTSGPNSVAQAAAVEAISGPQDAVDRMRSTFARRRARMLAALRSIDDLEVLEPRGSFYVFPRVDAFFTERVAGSQALCEHLLEKAHVAAVPGAAFGADGHIRLSFACSDTDIDEGVRRLAAGLAALR